MLCIREICEYEYAQVKCCVERVSTKSFNSLHIHSMQNPISEPDTFYRAVKRAMTSYRERCKNMIFSALIMIREALDTFKSVPDTPFMVDIVTWVYLYKFLFHRKVSNCLA